MGVYSGGLSEFAYNFYHSEDHSRGLKEVPSDTYVIPMADVILYDFKKYGYSWFVDKCATDKNFIDSESEQIISRVYNTLLAGKTPSQNTEVMLRFLKDYLRLKLEAAERNAHASDDERPKLEGQDAVSAEEKLRLASENAELKTERDKLFEENAKLRSENDKLIEEKKGIEYIERTKAEAERILEEAKHTREMLSRSVLEEAVVRDTTDFPEDRLTKQEAERRVQALENELWAKFDEIRNETKQLTMDFRLGLYRDESRKLCRAFVRLNEFATGYLDKQISEITDALGNDAAKAGVEAKLLEIQGRAIKLAKAFEVGMKYLEFAIIRPKPGEEYSPGEHLLAVGSDDGELEGTVKDCLSPGVKTASEIIEAAGVTVDPN